MHATVTHIDNPGPLSLTKSLSNLFMGLIAVGALAFIGGVVAEPTRAWQNYILNLYMFTGFALGGFAFITINRAAASQWSIIPRRLAEAFMSFLPVAFVLFLVALVGIKMSGDTIYSWLGSGSGVHSPTKVAWLSYNMMAGRNILFFLIWIFLARKLINYSVVQDNGQAPDNRTAAARFSIAALLLFAPTYAFFTYDLIMSQEPKWFSTMFTVYTFAGIFQSAMALMVIVFIKLKNNQLKNVATQSHVKDMSGLLFAFTIFMCYVAFSQFMLIWYANLPEETFYYLKRSEGGWLMIAVFTWTLKFILPFFGLLGQGQKKNHKWLMIVCWGVVAGQFLDLYWMTVPSHNAALVPISWIELGTLAMFTGLFGLFVSRWMSKHSLIPVGDPYVLLSANWRFWE